MACDSKHFPPGVYASSLTWFCGEDAQEIDYHLQGKHMAYLIESGITGVVIAGLGAESGALTNEKRLNLVSLTRDIASRLHRREFTIVISTLGQSPEEIADQLHVAAISGADFGLVLTPNCFNSLVDPVTVRNFFTKVADKSPIPILIHSQRLSNSQVDFASEVLELGKHPNIVGANLECGGIEKAVRIAAMFGQEEFCALAGNTDWLFPGLCAGTAGAISKFANLCPRTCMAIYESFKAGEYQEAIALQKHIAASEWELLKGGISGTKWTVAKLLGYGTKNYIVKKPCAGFIDERAHEVMLERVGPVFSREMLSWLRKAV